MLIRQSLAVMGALLVAVCAAQAQMPERGNDSPDRVSALPKDLLKFRIVSRLDLGLFALDTQAPESTESIPAFSRDSFDADQVRILMGRVGCGAGLRWTF